MCLTSQQQIILEKINEQVLVTADVSVEKKPGSRTVVKSLSREQTTTPEIQKENNEEEFLQNAKKIDLTDESMEKFL